MLLVGMKVSIKCNLGSEWGRKWDCTTTWLTTNQTRGELIARRGCWRTHGIGRSRWTGLVALQLESVDSHAEGSRALVRVTNLLLCRLSAQQAVQEQVIEKAISWVFAGTCCYKPAKGIVQLSMARRHLAANHEESRTESANHIFCMFLLVVASPP